MSFGEPHTERMRQAIISRYQLLPLWYTYFISPMLVVRQLCVRCGCTTPRMSVFGMDDQFLAGFDLLVKPVVKPGVTSMPVYLPGGKTQRWYDVKSHQEFVGGNVNAAAPIERIPVYQRGGSIVPRQMRLRRSSGLMHYDPYTLYMRWIQPIAQVGICTLMIFTHLITRMVYLPSANSHLSMAN